MNILLLILGILSIFFFNIYLGILLIILACIFSLVANITKALVLANVKKQDNVKKNDKKIKNKIPDAVHKIIWEYVKNKNFKGKEIINLQNKEYTKESNAYQELVKYKNFDRVKKLLEIYPPNKYGYSYTLQILLEME